MEEELEFELVKEVVVGKVEEVMKEEVEEEDAGEERWWWRWKRSQINLRGSSGKPHVNTSQE